ncbi:MAG: hypothetical protein IKD50_04685, partial [Clostridia bacterium]|nr:hypothetical protein [Clostridia bacterium]
LMTALSDVLDVGKDKLEENNQKIKELLGKLATHETFMDRLNTQTPVDLQSLASPAVKRRIEGGGACELKSA